MAHKYPFTFLFYLFNLKEVRREKKSILNYKKHFLPLIVKLSIAVFTILLIFFFTNQTKLPCANSLSCTKDLSGKYDDDKKGDFMGKTVYSPQYLAYEKNLDKRKVLGETSGLAKKIEINLTTQQLDAYEDEERIFSFPISSGKWYPTPTGNFKIWYKVLYTRMRGGNPANGTYYNLPNVPYVMFFYNSEIAKERGFAIHGAYWHDNFGYPMSHGCVNMRPDDALILYYWADPQPLTHSYFIPVTTPSTPVYIYGTPQES